MAGFAALDLVALEAVAVFTDCWGPLGAADRSLRALTFRPQPTVVLRRDGFEDGPLDQYMPYGEAVAAFGRPSTVLIELCGRAQGHYPVWGPAAEADLCGGCSQTCEVCGLEALISTDPGRILVRHRGCDRELRVPEGPRT